MIQILENIKNELIESFENGTLYEYLCDSVLEVRKLKNTNRIESLVFGLGGPNIILNMHDRNGVMCGYWASKEEFVPIPYLVWEDMEIEIIEMFEE